ELVELLYSLRGDEVVRHLMRVAGGLDSMVVGESEVLGQVKRAYELALVEGVTGPITNRLFRDAISTGKRVRSETGVGSLKTSVSTIAVELARETHGDLAAQHTIVIGAGGNGELTAKALSDAGVSTVFIANRRYDRAIGVAQRYGGKAVRFDSLPEELVQADIVLSSTASPHQIIGVDEMAIVMEQREGRPLLVIDIAVPRDIDPAVGDLAGVTLYDMDDLQRAVNRNISVRRSEATKAEGVVEQEHARFIRWMAGLEILPTVAALRLRGEGIAQQVVNENIARFEGITDDDRERLELMARSIVSRILHEPTLRLKRASDDDTIYAYTQALRELFALDPASLAGPTVADAPANVSSLEERREQGRKH
ncbi:MAG: glutamyl-tRNA reductase, partial [Thermoleophilaceae bacterium]|nr:glutamyl-tRNA reductase [Thermoleophilaceae bacterium]